jgi:hypothetical protein
MRGGRCATWSGWASASRTCTAAIPAVLKMPIFIDQSRAAAVALSRQATRGTRALGARLRDGARPLPAVPDGGPWALLVLSLPVTEQPRSVGIDQAHLDRRGG